MAHLYQTICNRDYNWKFLITEANKRYDSRRFDLQVEPTKYLAFGESTYSDHFGPKRNFPPSELKGPFAVPLTCDRARHLVSTKQHDYDGQTSGRYTGRLFQQESNLQESDSKEGDALMATCNENPLEILTTIGPAPLVKTCRQIQSWETATSRDYVYFPPRERLYPFPQ